MYVYRNVAIILLLFYNLPKQAMILGHIYFFMIKMKLLSEVQAHTLDRNLMYVFVPQIRSHFL